MAVIDIGGGQYTTTLSGNVAHVKETSRGLEASFSDLVINATSFVWNKWSYWTLLIIPYDILGNLIETPCLVSDPFRVVSNRDSLFCDSSPIIKKLYPSSYPANKEIGVGIRGIFPILPLNWRVNFDEYEIECNQEDLKFIALKQVSSNSARDYKVTIYNGELSSNAKIFTFTNDEILQPDNPEQSTQVSSKKRTGSEIEESQVNPHFNMLSAIAYGGTVSQMEQYLAKEQCDINQLDDFGCTPIFWAVYAKKVDMIEFLYRNGAEPDYINMHFITACDLSIILGISDVFDLQIKFEKLSISEMVRDMKILIYLDIRRIHRIWNTIYESFSTRKGFLG
jgi:hypothetical protein